MKKLLYIILISVFAITSCIDEVIPDPTPSKPNYITIEDGFVCQDTVIKIEVNGSYANDDVNVRYKYYLKTEDTDFKEVASMVTLKPYTQYWWYAEPVSYYNNEECAVGEPTEVRTFYCTPPIDVKTDNGDGDWAAVLRFKNIPIVGGTVTATSSTENFEIQISEGQDSCYIKYSRDFGNNNNAYIHWWDDEKGINYEPIIYTFKVELQVKVGDKLLTLTKDGIKEIILDKSSAVRDHEFNVYRVVKIGNRRWMADDLRVKSFIYKGDTIELNNVMIGGNGIPLFNEITLPESGSKGILYCIGPYSSYDVYFNNSKEERISLKVSQLIELLAPYGFHVSNNDDWEDLEKYYGVESPKISEFYGGYFPIGYLYEPNYEDIRSNYYINNFQGSDVDLRRRLSSMYDWKYYNDEEPKVGVQTEFNAKPFVDSGDGSGCVYYTLMDDDHKYTLGLFRILSPVDKGILNIGSNRWNSNSHYVQIRCVEN